MARHSVVVATVVVAVATIAACMSAAGVASAPLTNVERLVGKAIFRLPSISFRATTTTTTTTTTKAPLPSKFESPDDFRPAGTGRGKPARPGATVTKKPVDATAKTPTTSPRIVLETTTQDRSIINSPLKSCPDGLQMSPNRKCVPANTDPEDSD